MHLTLHNLNLQLAGISILSMAICVGFVETYSKCKLFFPSFPLKPHQGLVSTLDKS